MQRLCPRCGQQRRYSPSDFLTSLFFTPLLPAFVLLFKGPETSLIEASAIAEGRLKRCSQCTEAIRSGAILCRFCGSEQAPAPLL